MNQLCYLLKVQFGRALFCTLALLLLTPTAPLAAAAQPEILKIPVDFTETLNNCGFPVVHHVEGHVVIHSFVDENGNVQAGG
jgi:hypothetical protein